MKKVFSSRNFKPRLLMLICTFLAALAVAGMPTHVAGRLVIVGGGRMPDKVAGTILQLAGGKTARVVVVPYASRSPDAGERSRRLWQRIGAEHVVALGAEDQKLAIQALLGADLIWLPGGSQVRLMDSLKERGLINAIRQRFQDGAVVAGTSAGAAVMSDIMLSWTRHGASVLHGLGLWPDVIVDQHFLRRHRLARLREAILEHPDKLGVGIDEGTAVVVEGKQFEVVGRSVVTVLDARKATPTPHAATPAHTAPMTKYTLEAGTRFDLDKGLLSH